jgi:hypothetical protein
MTRVGNPLKRPCGSFVPRDDGRPCPALKPGNTFDYRYLTAHFRGTTDKVLVAEYSYGTSCLHIITSDDHSRAGLSNDDGLLFKLAKPELIDLHRRRLPHRRYRFLGQSRSTVGVTPTRKLTAPARNRIGLRRYDYLRKRKPVVLLQSPQWNMSR